MNSKAGKGVTSKFRKIIPVSAIALFLFIAGCKKQEDNIPSKVKSIEQSAVLYNDVEIKYSANIKNVDYADLKVKKDGVLIATEQIMDVSSTGADYSKTYSYSVDPKITKGNYEFTLTSDNLEKKSNVTIPDYPMSISINGANLNINENSQIDVKFKVIDRNPDDNPASVNQSYDFG